MKRRLCSYDVAEVPQQAFVLTDDGGETYFCNLRCLCVWSVQLATRPNQSDEQRSGLYILHTQSDEEHEFAGIDQVAHWAVDAALRRTELEVRVARIQGNLDTFRLDRHPITSGALRPFQNLNKCIGDLTS